MKVDKFDTTQLKAGIKIPCVAQGEKQDLYCYATVCTVNDTGFLVQTEESSLTPVWLAYYHDGRLIDMKPVGENKLVMRWEVMEPTEENKNKVDRFKALQFLNSVKFNNFSDEALQLLVNTIKGFN
jgi:hypothetical protein